MAPARKGGMFKYAALLFIIIIKYVMSDESPVVWPEMRKSTKPLK